MKYREIPWQARVDYIDLFRTLGIFLMIMGHVGFGDLFGKWIHAFHMPMFFIVSGYFYKEERPLALIKKRSKTVLLPYIVFGSLHCLLYFIFIGKIEIHSLYLLFWGNTSEGGIPIAGALWFLTCIFFAEIIYNYISISLRGIVKLIVVILTCIIGMVIATYLQGKMPWSLDSAMVGVGFLYFGQNLKGKTNFLINLKCWHALVGLFLFSGLTFVNGYINLRTGQYAIWPLFWINAIGLSVSFWNLSRVIYNGVRGLKFTSYVIAIGRNSIIYLCLNQLVIYVLNSAFGNLFLESAIGVIILRQLILLGVVILILKGFELLIIRSKLRVLIGK